MFIDLKSDVLTLQNQCPKVNPSVSKISLPLQVQDAILFCRDAFLSAESSWICYFVLQRCFSGRRIIPERGFCSAGMKSAEKNHPWEEIFISRDEISGAESSLGGNSYRQR